MTVTLPGCTFEQLTSSSNRDLESLMTTDAVPRAADVVGFEFRGWNLQAATVVLGTRKFVKGFFRGSELEHAWGYNMPVAQNDKSEPWLHKFKNGEPVRFYFFRVLRGSEVADALYPQSLVVDYRGWPYYSSLNPVRYTVDYLVYPDPENPNLLVGKSYLQTPVLRPFLGFFILERHRASDYAGPPGLVG